MPRINQGDDWGWVESAPAEEPTSEELVEATRQAAQAAAPEPQAPEMDNQGELNKQYVQQNGQQPYQGPVPGDGSVDNPIGQALEDLTTNILANISNSSPETVADYRRGEKDQQALQAEAMQRGNSKDRYNAIDEIPLVGKPLAWGSVPLEIGLGAALKTGEAIGNTGDLIQDTQKSLINQNIVNAQQALGFESLWSPLNPTDDIFSNEYDGAQVDLSSSQYADSGAGQVAKDFISFGATLWMTGGLKGDSGIRGAITAVKGGKGVKGAAQAFGGSGAARGVIADLMQNPEDGNLSNTIRDNAPEWYPTWLTALAVEDDDNPWVARIKTGLEGMGLSEAADGLVAIFKARNAARKAMKNGASQEDAITEGLVAAQKDMPNSRAYRKNWGNVARRPQNVQYFTLGPRSINNIDPSVVPYKALMEGDVSGFTKNPLTGEEAVDGYMVNIDGAKDLLDLSPESITRWITDNAEALSREDTFIGGYIDEMGRPVLEISRQVMDRSEAIRLGVEFDQETIYDVAAGRLSRGEGDPGQLDLFSEQPSFPGLEQRGTQDVIPLDARPVTPQTSDVSFPPSSKQIADAKAKWESNPNRATPWDELTEDQQQELVKTYLDNKSIPTPKPTPDPQPYIRTAGVSEVGMTRNAGFRDLQWRPHDPTPQVTLRTQANIGDVSPTKKVPQEYSKVDMTDAAVSQSKGTAFNVRPTSKPIISKASMKIIGSSQDGQKLLKKFTNKDPDLQAIANKAGKTPQEIRAEAAESMARFNGDPESLGTQILDGTKIYTQPGMIAAKTLIGDISSRLAESVVQVRRLGDNGMDSMPAVVKMVDEMKALLATYKYTTQAYGRGLNNLKIPALGIEIPNYFSKQSPADVNKIVMDANQTLDKLVKDLASGDPAVMKNAEIMAGRLMLAGGDPALMRSATSIMGGVLMKSGLQAFYNSMLSGLKTQVVNTTSTAMNAFYRPFQAMAGSVFTKDGKMHRQAAAATYAAFGQNLMEAWSVAARVWENGGNAINDGSKGFVRASEAQAAVDLVNKMADGSGDKSFIWGARAVAWTYNLVNNPYLDWPSRFMTTTDEFFKTFAARNEFVTRNWMEAAEKTSGVPGDQTKALFEQLMKTNADRNFDNVSGAILDEDLLKAGKETTFQTDLEGKAAQFARFVDGVPLLRVFFPFIKTGHNIMVYTAQHTPLAHLFSKEYRAAMRGSDELLKAQMKGRMATGSFVIGTAGVLAMNGMLTGNGPSDPEQKKVWMENNKPRSINIPGTDTWIDYSRLEPFNMLLGGVADIHYGLTTGELSEDMGEYLAAHLAYSIAANFTQKSYYQGLIPFAQILQPNAVGGNKLVNVTAETVNNLAPYAGLRRNIANALTPDMMEFADEMERLKFQASGGMIGTAAPRYDWLKNDGTPTESPSGGGNSVWPYRVQQRKVDPVRDELEDIGLEVTDIIRRSGVEMTPVMISKVQLRMGDGELYKDIKRLQGSKAYQDSKDKATFDAKNNKADYARVKGRKGYSFYQDTMGLIDAARDDAINHLYQTDDDFRAEADAVNKAQARAQMIDQPLNTRRHPNLDYLIELANPTNGSNN